MSKNKLRPKKERKEKKENESAFPHIRAGKSGRLITTIFCTSVEVSSVMTCAHLMLLFQGTWVLVEVQIWGLLYFVVEPYNCSTNVLLL